MLNRSFWNNKRVLLTGHTGFKGSWLLTLLSHLGARVSGFALPPKSKQDLFSLISNDLIENFIHYEGDLSSLHELKQFVDRSQPDIVIHLAAQPLVRHSYIDPIGTWKTNVLGSLHLLEALKNLTHPCAVVMVTTDKVYSNREWVHGYRETDRLGGHDPYSASKAATELAVASWRSSFCGDADYQTPYLRISTVRAGNVIGGGDLAQDRIVPDAIRSLTTCSPISVRNPCASRPWQHVLEPLCGYLLLAQHMLTQVSPPCEAFNFGPTINNNRTVEELVNSILTIWPGEWKQSCVSGSPHESGLLHLQIDKAYHQLGWHSFWDFETTVSRTVNWYLDVHNGFSPYERLLQDIHAYLSEIDSF